MDALTSMGDPSIMSQKLSRNQRFVAGIVGLFGYTFYLARFGTPFSVIGVILIFVSTTSMAPFALGGMVKRAAVSSVGVTVAMVLAELL